MFFFPFLWERPFQKTGDQLWPCTQDVLLLFENVRPLLKYSTVLATWKEKGEIKAWKYMFPISQNTWDISQNKKEHFCPWSHFTCERTRPTVNSRDRKLSWKKRVNLLWWKVVDYRRRKADFPGIIHYSLNLQEVRVYTVKPWHPFMIPWVGHQLLLQLLGSVTVPWLSRIAASLP